MCSCMPGTEEGEGGHISDLWRVMFNPAPLRTNGGVLSNLWEGTEQFLTRTLKNTAHRCPNASESPSGAQFSCTDTNWPFSLATFILEVKVGTSVRFGLQNGGETLPQNIIRCTFLFPQMLLRNFPSLLNVLQEDKEAHSQPLPASFNNT